MFPQLKACQHIGGSCEAVYRIGRYDQKKTRPIMVRFKEAKSKGAVYSNVRKLGHPDLAHWKVSISDDLTKLEQKHMRDLRTVAAHA